MASDLRIEVSSVFMRTLKANTRLVVHEGSSRSTKTYSVLQYLIMRAQERKRKITIARAKMTWLRKTIIPDFIDIMSGQFGIFDEACYNKSEQEYYFNNGSMVQFLGLDEAQRAHGMKQDIVYVNEAIEVTKKKYNQLIMRTTEQVILDYNPSTDVHWIYTDVIPRNDCTFIKSTYKDNPFLEKEIIAEIERLEPTPENIAQGTADEVAWKIYGLGERATQRGLIFGDAQLIREMPNNFKKEFYGLDFGFTNDPTTLIHVRLAHGGIYLRQLLYKRGLTNIKNPARPDQPSIEGEFERLKIDKRARIWADSAEPKSIQDLKNCGYNVMPTVKGQDSIVNGIDTMKRYPIFITHDSVDLIKERNNYKWAEDKEGKSTNKPIDAFNHGWDASRYGCVMELDRPTPKPKISAL